MYWWKSWDQKHVDRNSILECQIWNMTIFDVDTSQGKECVTTSDWKTELVAITLEPCEVCHSVLTCWSVKYISIHKRQHLLRAFRKRNRVPKKLQMVIHGKLITSKNEVLSLFARNDCRRSLSRVSVMSCDFAECFIYILACSGHVLLYSLRDGCLQHAEEKKRLSVWI